MATTVCACVAQSHLQSRRVAEICNSPPGREGPKFMDSVEGGVGGKGVRESRPSAHSEALSMDQHTLRMRDKCA